MNSLQDKRRAFLMRLTIRVFLAVGLVFIGVGAYLYRDTMLFMDDAQRLEGTVVGFVKGSGAWFPIVRYTGPSGAEQKLYCKSGSYPPDYFLGQQVKVWVDPTDPDFGHSAKIDSYSDVWGGPVFLIGFGALFFTVGASVRFLRARPGILAAWLD